MTEPQDVVTGGYRPAQDHDPDQELHGRVVEYAIRVERTTAAGGVVAEGHTPPGAQGDEVSASADPSGGDVHGRALYRAEDPARRKIPMWSYALPAVTVEPSRDLRPAPDSLSAPVGGTRVRPQPGNEPPPDAEQRVRVRPIGDPAFAADDRFRPVDAALSGTSPPLPRGYPGVVLVTTNERRQEEVFLPSGGAPLIAVDVAGPPETATLVSDLTPTGEIDPLRRARLHTMMRVVRITPGIGLGENNAIAWQLKNATQDGYSGGGLVIDQASVLGQDEDGTGDAQETLPDEPDPSAAPTGEPPPQQTQYGGVTDLRDYEAPEPHDGQYGGVTHLGPTRTRPPAGEGTKTRPPGGGGTTPRASRPPMGGGGNVVGACSAKLSGPLDVGREDDPHRLATTADGEPVNSVHVPCSALFLGSGGQDASLDFDVGVPYSAPPDHPFTAPVHLRYDPGVTHEWVGGTAPGRWRWVGKVPYYTPEDQPPPWLPPPKEPPEEETRGHKFSPTPTPGGRPETGRQDRRPEWIKALEERLGLRPGSIGVSGVVELTPEQYEAGRAAGHIDAEGNLVGGGPAAGQPVHRPEEGPRPARYPTWLQTIRLASALLLQATATADGAPNVTGSDGLEQIPVETRERLHKHSPDVAQLVAFAAGDGTVEGAAETERLATGQLVGQGSILILPADVRVKDHLEGTARTGDGPRVYVVLPQGLSGLLFGSADQASGMGTGYAVQQEGQGVKFSPQDGAEAGTGANTVVGEHGVSVNEGEVRLSPNEDGGDGAAIGCPFGNAVEIWLTDEDGEEMVGGPTVLLGEGGVQVSDGDLTVSGGSIKGDDDEIIDPFGGLALAPLAARPAAMTTLGWGDWQDNASPNRRRFYDGTTDHTLAYLSEVPVGTLAREYNATPVSTSGSISATDDTVIVSTAGGAIGLTLPALSGVARGHQVTVVNLEGNDAITITRAGSDTIHAGTSIGSGADHGCVTLMADTDNSRWIVTSAFGSWVIA